MKNYEPLVITLITFTQDVMTDVITTSRNDDIGGVGDWE